MMRSVFAGAFLVVAAGSARAAPYDLKTVGAIFQEIDRRWPSLERNEYTHLIERADRLMNDDGGSGTPAEKRAFGDRYQRCKSVYDKIQEAFALIDEGVFQLVATDRGGTYADASRKFVDAGHSFGYAQRDWQAGTKGSCGETSAPLPSRILTARMSFPLEVWIEKAKQLDGLAGEREKSGKIPSLAAIKQAPRATVSSAAGSLPPKYVDNPQYGCGSLDAWQKTVTKEQPAGDLALLPGCTKLDDEDEGGATVQVLSKAKRLVIELDKLDRDGNDHQFEIDQMAEKLGKLKQALGRGVWKSAELDPMAMSFERLFAWETNQRTAIATRSDITNEMAPFWNQYDQKTGQFSGKHFDIFAANAEKCLKLIDQAQADGVDVAATTLKTPDYQSRITYAAARKVCRGAKAGMAAKKKAVEEAAAAEDAKWKAQCGGDKYRLWKAHGEYALSRGGWDQSRPETACKAEVWYSHHGPSDNQVYDCDKYTFAGNKQTAHATKSTRFHMVCP